MTKKGQRGTRYKALRHGENGSTAPGAEERDGFILLLSGEGRFVLAFGLMKSHELLREVIEKCSPKQMAADLGVSLSLVYKWAEPPEEQGAGGTILSLL